MNSGLHRLLVVLASVVCLNTTGCAGGEPARVMTGAEVMLSQRLAMLEGKDVGLITNHTGKLPDGRMFAEELVRNGITLKALFAPEHGFLGVSGAGEPISDETDPLTGIPVHSLYGKTRKPTPEMLEGLDLLIYDIQDVGVRFYTYISTMGLAMEAAAEAGLPFVVLDRPNPQGGLRVEGPVMEDSLRTFVGLFPIPVLYGLTCGELAMMIAGEGWLKNGMKPDLHVIPMTGWSRHMLWDSTGLPWVPPSPNIPDLQTSLLYPATCYIEATALSEGRGTSEPFRLIGAPFIDSTSLATAINSHELQGVSVSPVQFVPQGSKHKGSTCGGIRVSLLNPTSFEPAAFAAVLLSELVRAYPSEASVNRANLGRLLGSGVLVDLVLSGTKVDGILPLVQKGVESFREKSHRYFIYP